MKKAQLPECGLCRKSAVLLAIFFAIVSNLPAQGPSPSPSPPPDAQTTVGRDAQGNVVPASSAAATAERGIVTGSSLPSAEAVGANPVDIYRRRRRRRGQHQAASRLSKRRRSERPIRQHGARGFG